MTTKTRHAIPLSLDFAKMDPAAAERFRKDQKICKTLEDKKYDYREIEQIVNNLPDDIEIAALEDMSNQQISNLQNRKLLASYAKTGEELRGGDAGASVYFISGSTYCSAGIVKHTTESISKYAYAFAAHCKDDTGSNTGFIYLANRESRIINLQTNSWTHPNYSGSSAAYDIALAFPHNYNEYDAQNAIEICANLSAINDPLTISGLGNYRSQPGDLQVQNPYELCNQNTDYVQRIGDVNVRYIDERGGGTSWVNDGSRDSETSCPGASGGAVRKKSEDHCHLGVLSAVSFAYEDNIWCNLNNDCEYSQDSFFAISASNLVREQISLHGGFVETAAPSPRPSRATTTPTGEPSFIPTIDPSAWPSSIPSLADYNATNSTYNISEAPSAAPFAVNVSQTRSSSSLQLEENLLSAGKYVGGAIIFAGLCYLGYVAKDMYDFRRKLHEEETNKYPAKQSFQEIVSDNREEEKDGEQAGIELIF